jgi:hypothetical protein
MLSHKLEPGQYFLLKVTEDPGVPESMPAAPYISVAVDLPCG